MSFIIPYRCDITLNTVVFYTKQIITDVFPPQSENLQNLSLRLATKRIVLLQRVKIYTRNSVNMKCLDSVIASIFHDI